MNLTRNALHPYQIQAVEIIKQSKYHAFWMTPGKGKTICTLTALVDLVNEFEVGQILIIAPLRVAQYVWPDEINSWEHTKHLTFDVLHGKDKEKQAKCFKDIHIINREMVVWLVKLHGNSWPYDTVIIDESSSFKNQSSKRFKALKKTRNLYSRVYELTGSPASNGYLNVWPQIYLLDQGERLGKTFGGYKENYFSSDYNGWNWNLFPGAEKVIKRKIKDIVLTIDDDDYQSNERPLFHDIKLNMPSNLFNDYKKLEREFILEYTSEKHVEALSAGALRGKLLQFCNGAVYTDSETKIWKEFHQTKLDALEELIEELQGEPLLIGYSFTHDFQRIKKRFPKIVSIKDKNAINDWNQGEVSILVGHPASMGHGLNLQHGGHNIAWFGLNSDWELYNQMIRRLARQGQKKRVNVYHLIMENTIEVDLIPMLQQKHATEKDLMDAMKRGIEQRNK